jgi:hypothetical protein
MDDDHATERPRSDLDRLRGEFGDRWEFTAVADRCQRAGQEPDFRRTNLGREDAQRPRRLLDKTGNPAEGLCSS